MLEIVQSKQLLCKLHFCMLLLNIILLKVKGRMAVLAKTAQIRWSKYRQRVTILKYIILQGEKRVSQKCD